MLKFIGNIFAQNCTFLLETENLVPILKYLILSNLLLLQVFSAFCQQNNPDLSDIPGTAQEILDSLGIQDSELLHPETRIEFADSLGAGLKSLFTADQIIAPDTVKTDTIPPNVPVAKKDIETTIDYQARDSVFFDLETQQMYLYGEAKINYGAIQLEAERIDIDWVENTLKANYVLDTTGKKIGKPVFTEAKEQYVTDDMTYNFQSRKAVINGIITEQDGAFMHGEKVKKNEKDELFIQTARYTTCNLAEPHFFISSKKLKVIPQNKVVSGPFNLHFKDIPTPLGFFFGMFPQPRKETSGVIVPSWGEDPTRGFFLRDGGYYFSINDYVDLRLTGEIYSRGNFGLKGRSIYNKRYRYSGSVDMRYNKTVSASLLDDAGVSKDFWVNWSHSPQSRGSSRFSASVSAGTSSYNQNVNQVSTDFTRSISAQFNSNVSFSKTFQGTPFNMTVNLRQSQNVQTGAANVTLPELSFNASRVYPFKKSPKLSNSVLGKLGVSYNMVAKNDLSNAAVGSGGLNIINRSALDDEQVGFNLDNLSVLLDRSKLGMRHTIPISTSFKALGNFSVTPNFNYTEVWYPKELRYSYDEELEGVRVDTLRGFSRAGFYSTGASMNTTIYGTYFFPGKKIQAIRHVIIPAIGFSYSPDFSDPSRGTYQEVQINEDGDTRLLSKFNGFAYGGPGTGSNASMSFSLTNNIEMKVKTKNDSIEEFKKIKLFDNLSLSTGYNFLAEDFNLSPISVRARTSLFNKAMSIGFSGTIDPYIYVLDSTAEASGGGTTVYQRRIDKLALNSGQGLGQLSTGAITLVLSLRPKARGGQNDSGNTNDNANDPFAANQDPFAENDPFGQDPNNPQGNGFGATGNTTSYDPNTYVDFDIPWGLNVNYSLNYRKTGFAESSITQTLGFNGNVSITDKTKISFNSGYDIKNKEFTVTRLNLVRDLHCWTMNFSWVPFGPRQEYFVEIRVLSALLKDLKLDKKRRQQFTTF